MIEGFSGSGKTYSALLLAKGLAGDGKIAVIDTENKRSLYYANEFSFDSLQMTPPCSPESYIECIECAQKSGYSVLIIDSITQEWEYCLDLQSELGGRWQDWNSVTPRHNEFINAVRQADIHLISTVRSKVAYLLEEKAGKKKLGVQKAGTKAITRDGYEYENTVVFTLNANNIATLTKGIDSLVRCLKTPTMKLNEEHGQIILKWCNDGQDESKEIKPSDLKDNSDIFDAKFETKEDDMDYQLSPRKPRETFNMNYTLRNGQYKGQAIKDVRDLQWLSKWMQSEKIHKDLKPLFKQQFDDVLKDTSNLNNLHLLRGKTESIGAEMIKRKIECIEKGEALDEESLNFDFILAESETSNDGK